MDMTNKFTLITVLFVTIAAVELNLTSATGNNSTLIFYVTPDGHSCPNNVPPNHCNTLNYYCDNNHINDVFKSNSVLVFLSGTHNLSTRVHIDSVNNFTMKGNATVSYQTKEHRVPIPLSVVNCLNHDKSYFGFFFGNSSNIFIENLEVRFCGAQVVFSGYTINAALSFQNVSNILFFHLVTKNSTGFGIQLDNVYGNINVSSSAFLRSVSNEDRYGGNARFWFGQTFSDELQTNLTIQSSWFLYGNDTSAESQSKNSPGLTISIQTCCVSVVIDNITAAHNTGKNGGNMAIILRDFKTNSNNVIVKNSLIAYGFAHKGGGLRLWSEEYYSNYSVKSICYHPMEHRLFQVINTQFIANQANGTAGAVYIGHYESNIMDCELRQIVFTNCTFRSNHIDTGSGAGAVMEVIKIKTPGYISHSTPQFEIKLIGCSITQNHIHDYENHEGTIVDLLAAGKVTISNCNFTHNTGTAIALRNSNVIFEGFVHFENNSAAYGGALKMCDSSLFFVRNNTNITFRENHAVYTGGAIYAEQPCLDTSPACFFQIAVPKYTLIENLNKTMRLHFENNSADVAGDAIYGGAIDICYTLQLLKKTTEKKPGPDFFYSQQLFRNIFNMDQQIGKSRVASNPYDICFCNGTDNYSSDFDCSIRHKEFGSVLYPGQKFTISLVAVGQHFGAAPAFIQAQLQDNDTDHHLKTHTIQTPKSGCVQLEYSVFSNRSTAIIVLSLMSFASSDTRNIHRHLKLPNVTVPLSNCPLGFKLTSKPPFTCACDPAITKLIPFGNVVCNINSQTLNWNSRVTYLWLGGGDSNKLTLVKHCGLFCKKGQMSVVSTPDGIHSNSQCEDGYTGIMCKSCADSFSKGLGSSRCFHCKEKNYVWIFLICMAAGLGLVLILSVLNLTITEGTLNGLIFYANVIELNGQIFFEGRHTNIDNVFRIFIAWLNLDFGFEIYFQKSMRETTKVYYQFAFVLYLWFIQFLIVLLSHKFICFTRLVGRNFVKVMATLFLLSFTKLLNNSIKVFRFVRVHEASHTRLVWEYDGKIQYLKAGEHIALFIIAIVVCLLGLFFTLSLLFIQVLPKFKCLRLIERLRPFFDANTGPCRDNFRFWPGLLYIIRAALIIVNASAFNSWYSPANMFGAVIACIVVMVFACITPRGVYKKWFLNILEFSFFLNLFILCILMIWPTAHIRRRIFVYISVFIVMVTFVGIVIHHSYRQLKSSRVYIRLSTRFNAWKVERRNRKLNNTSRAQRRNTTYSVIDIPGIEESKEMINEHPSHVSEHTPLIQKEMPQVVRFNEYREPLIESEDN